MTKKTGTTAIITGTQVEHVAGLANLQVSEDEAKVFAVSFTHTMEVVNHLQTLDTSNIEPTHQVTSLTNRWREDIIDTDQEFTQEQALFNAAQVHEGYFIVPRIVNQDS